MSLPDPCQLVVETAASSAGDRAAREESIGPGVVPRRLVRNTLWNFLGLLVPLPLGILVIPLLTRRLGVERFGLLTLCWTILGYFSVFDLGLGRAVTKLAAERLAGGDRRLAGLYGTATALLIGLGVVAGLILAGSSAWLACRGLRLSDALRSEALAAFLLLSLSLPAMILASAPMGLLAAVGRFDVLNLVRLPATVVLFAGPALVALVTVRLPVIVGVLVASRFVALGFYLWACRSLLAPELDRPRFERGLVGPLLGFGGWMTLSSVISPLMISLDRFLIGALVSASAVAYYATPNEALSRLWGLPGAVVAALFPAFAATIGRDVARAGVLYERGLRVVFALLYPPTLALVVFAPEILGLWLGPDFRLRSATVLQLVAAGVFVYGLDHMPAELINAAGRPAVTAAARVLEAVIYLPLAWLLIVRFGIVGAAAAWALRILADTWILSAFADRLLGSPRFARRRATLSVAAGLFALLPGACLDPLALRAVYFFLTLPGLGIIFVLFWCDADERNLLGVLLRRVLRWQPVS